MEYKVYPSKLIQDNHKLYVHESTLAHNYLTDFSKGLEIKDSTWDYAKYNLFHFTTNSIMFYKLYKELTTCIRNFIGHDEPLWFQSWLNFHKADKVEEELKSHQHYFKYHGYISIEPHSTTTIFDKGYQIENKVGQIYIGPGGEEYKHHVKVNQPYTSPRITIGFDIVDTGNFFSSESWLPLL